MKLLKNIYENAKKKYNELKKKIIIKSNYIISFENIW